jgi:hypothetical protein
MNFPTSDVEPAGKKELNIFNRDIMSFPVLTREVA